MYLQLMMDVVHPKHCFVNSKLCASTSKLFHVCYWLEYFPNLLIKLKYNSYIIIINIIITLNNIMKSSQGLVCIIGAGNHYKVQAKVQFVEQG